LSSYGSGRALFLYKGGPTSLSDRKNHSLTPNIIPTVRDLPLSARRDVETCLKALIGKSVRGSEKAIVWQRHSATHRTAIIKSKGGLKGLANYAGNRVCCGQTLLKASPPKRSSGDVKNSRRKRPGASSEKTVATPISTQAGEESGNRHCDGSRQFITQSDPRNAISCAHSHTRRITSKSFGSKFDSAGDRSARCFKTRMRLAPFRGRKPRTLEETASRILLESDGTWHVSLQFHAVGGMRDHAASRGRSA